MIMNEIEVDYSTLTTKIITSYLIKQRQLFSLDFNDLISFTLYLFQEFPDVLTKWGERLFYIMIDEFQDTSKKEYDDIQELKKDIFDKIYI